MIAVLKKNRDINSCGFTVINKAISYDCDYINLNVDKEFVGSTIHDVQHDQSTKTVKIQSITIDKIMKKEGLDEVGIVCDIEGAESEIISRELPGFGDRVKFFMAEMHPAILGERCVEELINKLECLGFVLKEKYGDSVFFAR
jgi:FkbM family methyltransferase